MKWEVELLSFEKIKVSPIPRVGKVPAHLLT